MKTRDELTEDEKYFLQVYESDISPHVPSLHYDYAVQRGKEIAESLKPEQWEPKIGRFIITGDGEVELEENSIIHRYHQFGNTYQTGEEGEMVRDLQKELNIINQRVLEYNRENYVVIGSFFFFFLYDEHYKKWIYDWRGRLQHPGCVYTDEKGAETIIKELNAGLIKGIER